MLLDRLHRCRPLLCLPRSFSWFIFHCDKRRSARCSVSNLARLLLDSGGRSYFDSIRVLFALTGCRCLCLAFYIVLVCWQWLLLGHHFRCSSSCLSHHMHVINVGILSLALWHMFLILYYNNIPGKGFTSVFIWIASPCRPDSLFQRHDLI